MTVYEKAEKINNNPEAKSAFWAFVKLSVGDPNFDVEAAINFIYNHHFG